MLDIDIRPAGQAAAVVVMTRCTALLRALRGIGQRVVADIMTMRMAVEVVRRMTLAAITGRCDRSVACRVMTGSTAVMLLVVRAIDKVGVIDGLGMTAVTFGLQRDQGGVVLGGVGAEVTGDTTVTRATVVDRDADRAIRRMTGGTGVMLAIVGRINKTGAVGQGRRVTAGTAVVRGDITVRCMSDIVIGPVTTRMTGRTDIRTAFMAHRRADQGVGAGVVTGGAGIMDLVVARIGEGGRRIDVTDQTIGFTGHVTGTDVIDTMVD